MRDRAAEHAESTWSAGGIGIGVAGACAGAAWWAGAFPPLAAAGCVIGAGGFLVGSYFQGSADQHCHQTIRQMDDIFSTWRIIRDRDHIDLELCDTQR